MELLDLKVDNFNSMLNFAIIKSIESITASFNLAISNHSNRHFLLLQLDFDSHFQD